MDKSDKLWDELCKTHDQINELEVNVHDLLEQIINLKKQEEELKNQYAEAVLQIVAKRI